MGGRDSIGTALNEGANVFGAPDACAAELDGLGCSPSGDPRVPQGATDRDDAGSAPLRISDKISNAQKSGVREGCSDLVVIAGCKRGCRGGRRWRALGGEFCKYLFGNRSSKNA